MIIAVSIITSRAMAPVEQAIGHWRGFVAARQSWARMKAALGSTGISAPRTRLPRPVRTLDVTGLSVDAPGNGPTLIHDIAFSVRAGMSVGVIGPSGAGKSSLARALVGIWPPGRGSIRLDGAELDQWGPDELGRHLGYLPQEVELFEGTIADNISRLAASVDSEAVIAAAQQAGAHRMIVGLPERL